MKTIKAICLLSFLSFILFSCGKDKVFENENLVVENIETRDECSFGLFGPDLICETETATFCYKTTLTPISVFWSGHPSIIGSSGTCVSLSGLTPGYYTISVTLDFGWCQRTESHTLAVCGQAFTHPNPPIEFTEICANEGPVCFDFGSDACLTGMSVSASTSAIAIEAIGTSICIAPLHSATVEIDITVQALGVCEDGEVETWTITINNEDCDDNGYPPYVDPGEGVVCDPENGDGDCPPGEICWNGLCI